MSISRLSRRWFTKTEKILDAPELSTAEKVLAYKIFLRPMLIYDWFEGRNSQLKALEVQVLKRIFGPSRENRLYHHFSDIDVTKYAKLQEIRWQRATGTQSSNIRRLLYELSKDADDPSPYFITAREKPEHNSENACRNLSLNCSTNTPGIELRRSRRLADKNIFRRNKR